MKRAVETCCNVEHMQNDGQSSALEVINVMRSKNPRFTYLRDRFRLSARLDELTDCVSVTAVSQ